MMMFLLGMGATLLAVLTIFIIKKGMKDGAADITPEEVAQEMTLDEKAEIIAKYGKGLVPLKFTEHIHGAVQELHIQFIDVYGTRYSSIKDALKKSSMINKDVRFDLAQLDAELTILRNERENANHYYREENTIFDGIVRVYQPCKIKLDTAVRVGLGLPARMAVEITQAEDKTMSIETIYLAKNDVVNESSRYEFDLLNPEDEEAFDLLIGDDEGYREEMAQIEALMKHLANYNRLVSEDRIAITEDGRILIAPPTPAQILAKKGEVKDEVKKEVDNEFVSSTVTI